MSEEDERAHGAQVIRWALRIWANGKARSWSHALELAGTYAAPAPEPKPKPKRKTQPTT